MAIKHIFLKFGRAILHVFLKRTITHQTTAAKNSKTANHASCAHSLSFHSGFLFGELLFLFGFFAFQTLRKPCHKCFVCQSQCFGKFRNLSNPKPVPC